MGKCMRQSTLNRDLTIKRPIDKRLESGKKYSTDHFDSSQQLIATAPANVKYLLQDLSSPKAEIITIISTIGLLKLSTSYCNIVFRTIVNHGSDMWDCPKDSSND